MPACCFPSWHRNSTLQGEASSPLQSEHTVIAPSELPYRQSSVWRATDTHCLGPGSPQAPAPLPLCSHRPWHPPHRITAEQLLLGEALLVPPHRGQRGWDGGPASPGVATLTPCAIRALQEVGGQGQERGQGDTILRSFSLPGGTWGLPVETGPTGVGSEPAGGHSDAMHPQLSVGSRAAHRSPGPHHAGGAGLSTQLGLPVGYMKHSVLALPGSRGAPQAAHPTGKPPAHQTEQSPPQTSPGARLGGGCHYSSGINEEEPEEHISWEILQSFPFGNTLRHLHLTGVFQAPPPIK